MDLIAIIESTSRGPVGGKAFPDSEQGRELALSHGADLAAENSTVPREVVLKELASYDEFEEGFWRIDVLRIQAHE